MKSIAILGSTGSIGKSALEVIRSAPREFRVVALTANSNSTLLESQIREFRPKIVCANDPVSVSRLERRYAGKLKVFAFSDGLKELVSDKEIDIVLVAISGAAALEPLISAIDAGKDIALANKEALVMAGPLIMQRAAKKKVTIMPVDSEQSAIWQCLRNEPSRFLKNIYLTASGGPFRKTAVSALSRVSVSEVIRHPRWEMGRKISVDSASLMNKGLEVLEAVHLFGVAPEAIKVLVHPESVIHSMVEFIDGVILAQLSVPDMRIPIQYAFTFPGRFASSIPGVDFFKIRSLNFEKPDFKKFPCLGLAYQVARKLGTAPAVLNAANEVSVNEFLNNHIGFLSIPRIIERVLECHKNISEPKLDDIMLADVWARRQAMRIINLRGKR